MWKKQDLSLTPVPLRSLSLLIRLSDSPGCWCQGAHSLSSFLCRGVSISVLRHEAEFYGITPLGTCWSPRTYPVCRLAQRQSVFYQVLLRVVQCSVFPGKKMTSTVSSLKHSSFLFSPPLTRERLCEQVCVCACVSPDKLVLPVTVRRLLLCEELERSSCGSVLFHGYLPPPGTAPCICSDLSLSRNKQRN